jgi:hypothetical protein
MRRIILAVLLISLAACGDKSPTDEQAQTRFKGCEITGNLVVGRPVSGNLTTASCVDDEWYSYIDYYTLNLNAGREVAINQTSVQPRTGSGGGAVQSFLSGP